MALQLLVSCCTYDPHICRSFAVYFQFFFLPNFFVHCPLSSWSLSIQSTSSNCGFYNLIFHSNLYCLLSSFYLNSLTVDSACVLTNFIVSFAIFSTLYQIYRSHLLTNNPNRCLSFPCKCQIKSMLEKKFVLFVGIQLSS